MDPDFINYVYQPSVRYQGDRGDYPFKNKDEFLQKTNFDYVFYSHYYRLGNISEMLAIYHYINYGQYQNYETNPDDVMIQEGLFSTERSHFLYKKKILFVTHELSYTGGSIYIIDLYNYFSKRCNVDLLNLTPSVNLITSHQNLSSYDLDSYDLIVLNTIADNVVSWYQKNIRNQEKCILLLHETNQHFYSCKFKESCFKILVCDSYFVRKIFLENYKFSNALVKVLYLCNEDYMLAKNYPDISKENLRKIYSIPNDAIVYLNVGTISHYKDQVSIIRVLEHYISKNNEVLNIRFIFVGQGNNLIARYIKNSKYREELNHHVVILPHVPFRECHRYFAISDIYINCTRNEPFGRVLIESMEWSLPIIAFQGGSHEELIFNHFNGILYANDGELLEAILFFYNNRGSIPNYGRNGRLFYHKNIHNDFYQQISSLFSLIVLDKKIPFLSNENVRHRTVREFNLLESARFIYKDKLYIWGGYKDNSNAINEFIYQFDPSDQSLQIINKIPHDCATTHATTLLYKDKVLILSGQIGKLLGKATDTFYVYNITNNEFIKNKDLPFALYDPKYILHEKTLYVFSGTTADRTTPNTKIRFAKILDDNDMIIRDPIWDEDRSARLVGTAHSSVIQVAPNEYLYLSGCGCHICSFYRAEQSMYSHAATNFRIRFAESRMILENISQQMFKNSHFDSSVFFHGGILFVIGGQLYQDRIYHGLQLYYAELDLWVELSISKEYSRYFNKGCISFYHNNQLFLTGGQFSENNRAIGLFNDSLLIFPLM